MNAEGKLGELSYPQPKLAAKQVAPVRHAVERTMLLLRAGTFSLAPNQLENGVQRLRIEFELSEVPNEGAEGVDHFQKGFASAGGRAPRPQHFRFELREGAWKRSCTSSLDRSGLPEARSRHGGYDRRSLHRPRELSLLQEKIEKGALRFGERCRAPSARASRRSGITCSAQRSVTRELSPALAEYSGEVPDRAKLEGIVANGLENLKLSQVQKVDHA